MLGTILNIDGLKCHLRDPLYRNSYFLMMKNIIGSILGFAFWIVTARYYSPNEVGLAVAIISALSLLSAFSTLGFDIGLIRFLPGENDKQSMINSCFTVTMLLSLIMSVIFITGIGIWSPALVFVRKNLIFVFLFILFTAISSPLLLQSNVFIAFRTAEYSFAQRVISSGLKIPLVMLLSAFGAFGIFSSWGMAMLAALIIGNLFIPKLLIAYRPIPVIQKRVINDMFHFSFGNYISGIFGSLPGTVLPLLIINVLNPEMTAYFFMAWAFSGVLYEMTRAINFSLLAEGTHEREKFRSNVFKATKFIFILLIPAIIAIYLFGDKILLLLGKEYSENALELLRILVLSSIPVAFIQLYLTVKRVQIKVKSIVGINALRSLLAIGLCYILMIKVGLLGIGVGWILSQTVAIMIMGLMEIEIKSFKR